MAKPILKQGSKGPLVQELQKYLNLKGNPPAPVPESGEFDEATKDAVRAFQKRAGAGVDGIVGSETAGALAKLVGASANGFAKAFGAAEAQATEEMVTITLKGQKGTMTTTEFEEFQKQAVEAIRGIIRPARMQAVNARTLWDHFNEMNIDQSVVAFCISITGPKLPDIGLIVDAESAVAILESALKGTDFDKIADAVQKLPEPVAKAAKAMWQYQKDVTGSTENWVFGLEITRDISFEVAKAIAKFESGGNPAASKAIDTAGEAIKSIAGEVGKGVAGTSGGLSDAAKNVARDTAIAGIMSLLMGEGSKGKAFVEHMEKGLVEKMAKGSCQWLASRPALQKFIAAWITKYLSANASNIAKESMKFFTSKMTFDQLEENILKGLVTSFPLAGLDSWVDQKFAKSTLEKMKKFPSYMKLMKDMKITADQEKVALDILKKELISGGSSKLVEKSLDAVVSSLSGNPTVDQVGNAAVEELAKSAEFKALCEKVAKQMK